MKRTTTEIAETIYAALSMYKLSPTIKQPTREEAIEAIAGCLNKNNGAWRRTAPKTESSRLLWQLVKFHRSSGSLWGFPWFADADQRDRLDTLALVMLKGHSRAAEAWRQAMA